jgi:hypothetical protein
MRYKKCRGRRTRGEKMMKNIENNGITATLALKNEVAGKTKPLFGQAKRHIQPERYVPFYP